MDNTIKDNLRQAYDRQAAERDASVLEDWKKKERDDFFTLLQKEKKHTLLEIGSGPGRDGVFFQENGLKVTCIDLSPEHVKLCLNKGLDARVMDMCSLSFPPGSFDSVYAMNSLLHLTKEELPGVLKSIDSLLKPEGLFYMGVYGGIDSEGIREKDVTVPKRFFSFYTDDQLKKTVETVFDIVYFRTISLEHIKSHNFQSLLLRKKPE